MIDEVAFLRDEERLPCLIDLCLREHVFNNIEVQVAAGYADDVPAAADGRTEADDRRAVCCFVDSGLADLRRSDRLFVPTARGCIKIAGDIKSCAVNKGPIGETDKEVGRTGREFARINCHLFVRCVLRSPQPCHCLKHTGFRLKRRIDIGGIHLSHLKHLTGCNILDASRRLPINRSQQYEENENQRHAHKHHNLCA